jgi:hypothetical protein
VFLKRSKQESRPSSEVKGKVKGGDYCSNCNCCMKHFKREREKGEREARKELLNGSTKVPRLHKKCHHKCQ